jgi:hypothetical protein
MIEEAAAAFRVSIEYGDKDENMHIFGVHGTALGALVVLHDDAHSSS